MSPVAIANREVSITVACRLVDMNVDGYAKTWCPFGDVTHADGGYDRAFRIYEDTNSAYCFACAEAYRPVSLIARARDISADEAAAVLLEHIGYVPENVDDRLDILLQEEEQPIDQESLASALSVFCSRIAPNWKHMQFDDAVATPYRKCLELLSLVSSPTDAETWLAAAKKKMTATLKGQERQS